MSYEHPIAKLRNALTPAYSLADLVMAMDEHPEIPNLKQLVIEQAKLCAHNKKQIEELLIDIANLLPYDENAYPLKK